MNPGMICSNLKEFAWGRTEYGELADAKSSDNAFGRPKAVDLEFEAEDRPARLVSGSFAVFEVFLHTRS